MITHDRFIRDAWFRKTMVELDRSEEVIREMENLANEGHTHIATQEELNLYRGNCWIRSNFVDSDTMLRRHRADFKKALSTLRSVKNEEDQAYYQNWWQSSSSSWWQWQDSWLHPSSETSPRRNGLDTDGAGEPSITEWCSDQFGNSQRKFAVTERMCKEYTSQHRKLTTETLQLQHEQQHEHWGQAWDQAHQQQVQCGAKSTMQSMSDVLWSWYCILHVLLFHERWNNRKQEVYQVRVGSFFYPIFLHQEKLTTRSQVREESG